MQGDPGKEDVTRCQVCRGFQVGEESFPRANYRLVFWKIRQEDWFWDCKLRKRRKGNKEERHKRQRRKKKKKSYSCFKSSSRMKFSGNVPLKERPSRTLEGEKKCWHDVKLVSMKAKKEIHNRTTLPFEQVTPCCPQRFRLVSH